MTVPGAYARAFRQLDDRAFRGPAIRAAAWSLAVFAMLAVVVSIGLGVFGPFESGLADTAVGIAGAILVLVLAFFLFPLAMTTVIGLYLDDVALAVEQRWYPGGEGRELPMARALAEGLRFAGFALLVNVLMIPLYLLALIPGLQFIGLVFYAVNGFLVGREYFEAVAMRHMPREAVPALRKRHRTAVWGLGVVGVFLMTIPLLNVIGPILITAAMVHAFKDAAADPSPR